MFYLVWLHAFPAAAKLPSTIGCSNAWATWNRQDLQNVQGFEIISGVICVSINSLKRAKMVAKNLVNMPRKGMR